MTVQNEPSRDETGRADPITVPVSAVTLAPLMRRVEAAPCNAGMILLWWFIANLVMCVGLGPGPVGNGAKSRYDWAIDLFFIFHFFVLPVLFNAAYSARRGGTFGMVQCELAYERHKGGPTTAVRRFCRAAVGTLCVPLVPVSLAIFLTDPFKRTLPDLLCGTTVCMRGERAPGTNAE